jgi:peroxiredoxin
MLFGCPTREKEHTPPDMKILLIIASILLAVFNAAGPLFAQQSSTTAAELQALVSKVEDKLRQGKKSEAALAPELKEFENLREKHKSEKTEDAAQITFLEAMLYLEVLDNTEKGSELIQSIKKDFPDTKSGQNADVVLNAIKQQETAKKIQLSLTEGAKFPDFEEKDLSGKPLSVSNYKGKVVLIDFWATWCAPCTTEVPNVVKAYEKHHDKGFEIIGISLDQQEGRLKTFIEQNKMNWPQYFDGLGWDNKLVQKYGIQKLPSTFLVDGDGKIIARDLRGESLDQALTRALAKQ